MSGNGGARSYKKDFWRQENQKYSRPHFRLEKSARIVNRIAGDRSCDLLDVGCGPATLSHLLRGNIRYHGIDIAIQDPRPNLRESDILDTRITFGNKHFDIIVAQGLFEYLGRHQSRKFAEIAQLLNQNGTFVVSYVNFDHRRPAIYPPYNNVQPLDNFRTSLSRYFVIRRVIPTSHNWNHTEPNRTIIKSANMGMNVRVPLFSPRLAVSYFFVCARRDQTRDGGKEAWVGEPESRSLKALMV